MDQEQTYLRSKDVAQLLDCGPDEVSVLAKHGKLQAEKVGSRWRYRLSDVQKYMRENQKEK